MYLALHEYYNMLSFINQHGLMDSYINTLRTLSIDYDCIGELRIYSIVHIGIEVTVGYTINLIDNTNEVIVKVSVSELQVSVIDYNKYNL